MQLSWVDMTIIGMIGLSVLTGLFRGFVKELIALFVWILALWLAFTYSPGFEPWLQKYIHSQTARTGISFILILMGTLIIGGIINAFLSFILKRSGLSGTDRILGMVFGFIRGVLIVALMMVLLKMAEVPLTPYSTKSYLYAKFEPVTLWLGNLLPNFERLKHLGMFSDSPPDKETPT